MMISREILRAQAIHQLCLFVLCVAFSLSLRCQEAAFTIEYRLLINETPGKYTGYLEQAKDKWCYISDSFYLEQPISWQVGWEDPTARPRLLYRLGIYPPTFFFPHSSKRVSLLEYSGPLDPHDYENYVPANHIKLDSTRAIAGYECIGFLHDGGLAPNGKHVISIYWVSPSLKVPNTLLYQTEPGGDLFWPGGFRGTPMLELGNDKYADGVLVLRNEAVKVLPYCTHAENGFEFFEKQLLGYDEQPFSTLRMMLLDYANYYLRLRNVQR